MTIDKIAVTEENCLDKLVATAPADDKKKEAPQTDKKTQKQSDSSHDWGILDVRKYLDSYGIAYSVKDEGDRTVYQLKNCLFDPTHTDKEASIVQDTSGGKLTYHCFHNSCKSYTFRSAKEKISGAKSLREYMTGYNPAYQPRKKEPGSGVLDRISIEEPSMSEKPGNVPESENLPDLPAVPPPHEIDPLEFFLELKSGKLGFVPARMAKYFCAHLGNLVHTAGCFYQFIGGYWQEISEFVLYKICVNAMKDYLQSNMIDGSIKTLRGLVNIEPKDWPDLHHGYINCLNGMVDTKTFELLPHDPKYYSRAQIPCNFDISNIDKAERWHQALDEIFPNEKWKIDLLQECFGYCLLPDCRFEKMFFFIGGGGNGKGTVLTALSEIIGKDNISSLTMRDLSDPKFSLYFLQDKLVNIATELSHRDPVATEHLKTIVSGEWLTAEKKHGHKYQFKPYATMILAMNDVPVIPDRSYGFERRLIILRFTQTFTDKTKDPHLKEKLIKEKDGIFAWALMGLSRLLERNGFTENEGLEKEKTDFIKSLHPLLQFVEEKCEFGDDIAAYREEANNLYDEYNKWCKSGNYRALARNRFTDHILMNFPKVEKRPYGSNRRSHFLGIRIHAPIISEEPEKQK